MDRLAKITAFVVLLFASFASQALTLRVTYTGPVRDYQQLQLIGIYYPDKTSFAGLSGKWTWAAPGSYMQETTGGTDASWIANGPYYAKVYSSLNSTPWFVGPVAYTGGGLLNIDVTSIDGPPPEMFWIRHKLVNLTSLWQTNTFYNAEVPTDSESILGWVDVPPRTTTPMLAELGPYPSKFAYYVVTETESDKLPITVGHFSTNAFSSTPPGSGATTSTGSNPNALPTITPGSNLTTNWVFSTNAPGAARDSTLQEGFSGLRSILEEGQNKASQDAKGIKDALSNTNVQLITEAQMTSGGNAAGTATKDSLEGAKTGVQRTMAAPGGSGGAMQLALPGNYMFGAATMDISPTSIPALATLAGWIRTAFLWVAVYWFVRECMSVCEHYLAASTAARQASSAGTTVLGTNINTGAALGMAGLITVALAAIPAIMVGITSSMTVGGSSLGTILGGNILSGVGGLVGTGLNWANQVFPIVEACTLCLMYLGFRFQVGAVYTVATTAVRFFVG